MSARAASTQPWPVWTVPAGLVAGVIAGQIAALVFVAPVALTGAGDGDVTGVALLFSSLGFGAALLATIALFVRSSSPLSARALGLRPVALRPALAWSLLGAALIAAFVFFVAQIADLSDLFAVPSELDGRSSLAEQLQVGPPAERADVGVGALASALARVVVPAIVAELVLRGFALQALARWRGEPVALAITALLTVAPLGFALGGPTGADALLPIALLLGVVLGLLYLLTSSLLPGIALSAAVMGAGLGESFAWSAPGIALLAAGCCAAAVAIAVPVAARSSAA